MGTFVFRALCTFFHTHDSLLTVFVYLSYSILAVPICECLGNHSCMRSPFPPAILNGTLFFCVTTLSKRSKSRLSKTDDDEDYPCHTTYFCLFVLFNFGCSHTEDFGKYSCTSSTFPIAILNGTCYHACLRMDKVRNEEIHRTV